jgi:hypothetical protein
VGKAEVQEQEAKAQVALPPSMAHLRAEQVEYIHHSVPWAELVTSVFQTISLDLKTLMQAAAAVVATLTTVPMFQAQSVEMVEVQAAVTLPPRDRSME